MSRRRRFWRLAGMTAQLATSYAGSRLKAAFLAPDDAAAALSASDRRSGERIARTLGELKGAVMKVGQMASLAADLLPRELAEPLRSLQREAPPVDFDVIAGQIEAELGSPPGRLFDRFERQPFAAASIGQVHRARADDGREVVVKVQYPGVDGAVGSDLAHLKLMLRAGGLVKFRREDLDAVFAEVRARLHEELDYCREADNLRRFRAYHRRHPWVVIPEVVGERSAGRVLTLVYEPGDRLDALDADSYPQKTRDLLGARLFTVFAAQIFDLKLLHADPHPGNLAVRRDGTLVLYDFGCVKELPAAIVDAYRETVRSGLDEDYEGVERGLRALGVREEGGPPVPPEFYRRWRDVLARPFLGEGAYDYGAADVHDDAVKLIPGALRHLDSFRPPPDLVFLDRTVVGHYANLRALAARGRFIDLLRPHLECA